MITLITDFDGPIMDVSERYYRVYQRCLSLAKRHYQEVTILSFEEFWQLKRARVPEVEIGRRSGLEPEQTKIFAHLRKTTVHALPNLVHDRVVPGAIQALEKAQSLGIELVVMTMRRTKELETAFRQYDLEPFFDPHRRYCMENDYLKTTDVGDKPLLMAKYLVETGKTEDIWMVGDTEADIVAAKTHNIKIISVLSGIRDRERLVQYQPDLIVNNLLEAVEIISQPLTLSRVG